MLDLKSRIPPRMWMRGGLARESYHKEADASEATACQMTNQNPSDRSNTTVKDAPSDQL